MKTNILKTPARLGLIQAFTLLFCMLLTSESSSQTTQTETHAERRLAELIEHFGENDEAVRAELIISIFSEDDDPDELRQISSAVHEQTGKMALRKILESEEYKIVAVCETESGPLVKISMEVETDGDHRISNIFLGQYETPSKVKDTGVFIALFDASGQSLEEARGVWLAKGYGYIIEITKDDANFYDYTGTRGWKADSHDDEDQKSELLIELGQQKDKARISFHPKEHGYIVTRLKKLPECCRKTNDWSPTDLFDLFDDVMRTHYPFFEVRKIDWNSRVKAHRKTISDDMSETELFAVFEKMLTGFNDAHTRMMAEIDGELQVARGGQSTTIARLRESYEKQSEPKSKREFLKTFRDNMDKTVMEKVLHGEGKKSCANKFNWGFADKEHRIGYLRIKSMTGFSLGNMNTQIEAIHKSLDEVLTAFRNTESLIIDITMNGGGSDAYSIEIASHFADQERIGFSKWPAAMKEYRQDRKVVPYNSVKPDGVMYLKPIYVVTNNDTGSAAEIFTMCMRSLPNVTTVGETTSGALSDVLDKSLPNGWEFMTSNEVYVDHEGICHEGIGIPPKIALDILDPEDVLKSVHHETIGKIVKMALDRLHE